MTDVAKPKASTSMGNELLKYPENFTVSRTPKGRYEVVYNDVKLPYSLATLRNVNNFIVMTQQILVQYDSCKAQRWLLDIIWFNPADCTFMTRETILSGVGISINNSLLSSKNIIPQEQFQKALSRIVWKHGKEVAWVTDENELWYFLDKFSSFANTITQWGNDSGDIALKNKNLLAKN